MHLRGEKVVAIKNHAANTTNLSLSIPSEMFLFLRETENQFAENMKIYCFIIVNC